MWVIPNASVTVEEGDLLRGNLPTQLLSEAARVDSMGESCRTAAAGQGVVCMLISWWWFCVC